MSILRVSNRENEYIFKANVGIYLVDHMHLFCHV